MKKLSLALLLIAAGIPGPMVRATTPPYDAFLLPIVVSNAPGAFGSRWDTSIFFAHTGTASFDFLGNVLVLGTRDFTPGERGELQLFNVPQSGASPGLIFDTTAQGAADLHLVCYVHERSGRLPGVTIPAVRSTDLVLGATVRLLGVPISDDSRTLVRIYDVLRNVIRADVTVRVYNAKGELLRTDVVHLDTPSVAPSAYAPYGEYRPPVTAADGPISIEVEPPNLGFRLWAFSTTTDNTTQAVTPVFPAP
jgi:hypothetical protein